MMTTDRLGLYVHIPYCVRKCNYCDFCSLPTADSGVPDEYVSRLCDEIASYSCRVDTPLDTVYFGGGTPSLLFEEQISRIFGAIASSFRISENAEITFEANPGTLTLDKARAFRAAGFNRVSIGLQSIHEKELKKLGRIHNYNDFLTCYSILREIGFDNISVDLMYGIPYQTKESFKESLCTLVALSPEHISAYGLMVEEGTPFFEEDDLPTPSEDDECDMYDIATDILRDAGYEHYEISNYAKAGKRSRHNSLYWHLVEYIGVGAAAYSFFGGKRFCNTDDVASYISGAKPTVLDDSEVYLEYEYAMLALRLKDGISLSDYRARFGHSFIEGRENAIAQLEQQQLISVTDDRIALTEKGFYVSNSIILEIV